MSLLIQGMETPESGRKYPAILYEKDGRWWIMIQTSISYSKRQIQSFPISEIPPHGRLIDADELFSKVHHDTPLSEVFEKTTKRYIGNCQTIIPASAEVDDGEV